MLAGATAHGGTEWSKPGCNYYVGRVAVGRVVSVSGKRDSQVTWPGVPKLGPFQPQRKKKIVR